ncbi:adhesion G protein-coupled receptor L3-like [Pseudorasbora parva]|uniref:adhesion G protein-coupled receptor L3-like n=1 Tax=Pseudorasbora parva TaxID=51549 RepID=UPI00351F3FA0
MTSAVTNISSTDPTVTPETTSAAITNIISTDTTVRPETTSAATSTTSIILTTTVSLESVAPTTSTSPTTAVPLEPVTSTTSTSSSSTVTNISSTDTTVRPETTSAVTSTTSITPTTTVCRIHLDDVTASTVQRHQYTPCTLTIAGDFSFFRVSRSHNIYQSHYCSSFRAGHFYNIYQFFFYSFFRVSPSHNIYQSHYCSSFRAGHFYNIYQFFFYSFFTVSRSHNIYQSHYCSSFRAGHFYNIYQFFFYSFFRVSRSHNIYQSHYCSSFRAGHFYNIYQFFFYSFFRVSRSHNIYQSHYCSSFRAGHFYNIYQFFFYSFFTVSRSHNIYQSHYCSSFRAGHFYNIYQFSFYRGVFLGNRDQTRCFPQIKRSFFFSVTNISSTDTTVRPETTSAVTSTTSITPTTTVSVSLESVAPTTSTSPTTAVPLEPVTSTTSTSSSSTVTNISSTDTTVRPETTSAVTSTTSITPTTTVSVSLESVAPTTSTSPTTAVPLEPVTSTTSTSSSSTVTNISSTDTTVRPETTSAVSLESVAPTTSTSPTTAVPLEPVTSTTSTSSSSTVSLQPVQASTTSTSSTSTSSTSSTSSTRITSTTSTSYTSTSSTTFTSTGLSIAPLENCTAKGRCVEGLLQQIENITAEVLPFTHVTTFLDAVFNASEKILVALSADPNKLVSDGNRLLKASEKLVSMLVNWTDTTANVNFTLEAVEGQVFMVGPNVTLDKIPRLDTTHSSVDIDLIEIAKKNCETRSAAVAFMSYKTMENLLKPDFFKTPNDTIKTMMSTVISATLPKTTNTKLTKPVNFTLRHIREFDPSGSLSCVYWNISEWIVDGCSVLETNSSFTVCSCVHLSTFALIMQTSRPPESDSLMDLLNLMCVIVGLVFFSLALLTFALCQWSPGVNNVARINLCVSLLLAHLLFLLTQQFLSLIRREQVLCAVISGVLHFLFLSGFVWMFIEAVLLFICVKNLSQISSKKRKVLSSRFLCVIGYTVPLVVVGMSAVVDPKGYESKDCWIKEDKGFFWSFLGPVAVIMALNMIILINIIISLNSTLKKLNPDVSQMKRTKIRTFKTLAQFVVLGCSWILGPFSNDSKILEILFVIVNSQQGTFIFLVYCVLNDEVRQQYRNWWKVITNVQMRHETKAINPYKE